MKVTTIAHPNIALVKYWGKRNATLNLPATGSYSLTLSPMHTRTTLIWGQEQDALIINDNAISGRPLQRIQAFLNLLRRDHPTLGGAHIESTNDFPTAAGLASSSSAFAALAKAATTAANLNLDDRSLSILARQGSGSAARSIFGGFARMHAGNQPDGSDAYAEQTFDSSHWDLRVLFVLTHIGEKDVSSTAGMQHTVRTSPYFDAWCNTVPKALDNVHDAIATRDFERLAELAEASALQMHASAIAAVPGVLYWNPATVAIIHAVRTLRAQGTPAFFTIDAGPHVKVFVPTHEAASVSAALREIPGVHGILQAQPGTGVHTVSP